MSGFIPEITTIVSVTVKDENLNEAINLMESSDVLNACFSDVYEDLKSRKEELEKLADPVALAISENLASHQSQVISTKHKVTGMMMNSVDITKDGDGQYLVGNTATTYDGFPYPLTIEFGRKGYTIFPVHAKALHFWTNGEEVFTKKAEIPPMPPDPFVQHSIDMTEEKLEEIISEYVGNVMSISTK